MEQEVKKKRRNNTDDNMAKSINKKSEVKKNKKKKNSPLVPVLCLIIGILVGIIGAMLFLGKDDNVKKDNNVISESTDKKNTVEEMMENEEAYTIETPYGNLYYPEKWESQLRVEQVEGDVYTVQFFGTIEGKEEQHLFDIIYGDIDGEFLGTLEDVNMYMVYADILLDDTWSTEEADIIYAMQEDVNYLMGMLEQEKGFIPAN